MQPYVEQDRAITRCFCSNSPRLFSGSLRSYDNHHLPRSSKRPRLPPVVGARGAGDGPVRDDPGRCDRQRRAAVDPGGSRLLAGGPAMGGDGVHDPLRWRASARRAAGRSPRSAAPIRRRHGGVHRRFAVQRPGVERHRAHRRPGDPGSGRGAARTGGALGTRDHLSGGPRAQPGPWHLGRSDSRRRLVRTAARWRADRRAQLGGGSSSSTSRLARS